MHSITFVMIFPFSPEFKTGFLITNGALDFAQFSSTQGPRGGKEESLRNSYFLASQGLIFQ